MNAPQTFPGTFPETAASPPSPAAAPLARGWTAERKAASSTASPPRAMSASPARGSGFRPRPPIACAGASPLFARGWNAALVLAQEASEQVLADRAIDGIEEEVWYRGELVGTRTRHDTRLFLAHLARLDRLIEEGSGVADAARFDELIALVAGEKPPEDHRRRRSAPARAGGERREGRPRHDGRGPRSP